MFVSDNVSCVCPEVMSAIEAANSGDAVAYGGDEASNELNAAFSSYLETPVTAFPVGSGTAANALSLALATPRFAAIYCYESAHIETTECGASEAWAGGSKLILLPGENYRISAEILKSALGRVPRGRPQSAPPAVVSITQGTEVGTLYTLDQIKAISQMAHDHGLLVHMDGARFSNAIVALGCSPADMTWRAGIDILSYGATKNGGMCADGVVVINRNIDPNQIGFLRRRNGQLVSKARYLSVQLLALIRGGAAERNAAHANRMASRLAAGLAKIPGARLLFPVEINEIFVFLPGEAAAGLEARGYGATLRNDKNGPHYRFVTSWNTAPDAVDQFVAAATAGAGARRARA